MARVFNLSPQTPKRQRLRTHSTRAEAVLWLNLKGRQMLGYKFRRQHGIGRYIVDFYCPDLRLALEVDGATHESEISREEDQKRQLDIESLHIRVLRFTDDEVLGRIDAVLASIEKEIMGMRQGGPLPPRDSSG